MSFLYLITNIDASIPIAIENIPELEEGNPQDLYRSPAKETCLIPLSPQSLVDNECINVSFSHLLSPSIVTKFNEKKL